MKKIDTNNLAYKLGNCIAVVVSICLAACVMGIAIALTAWFIRFIFGI